MTAEQDIFFTAKGIVVQRTGIARLPLHYGRAPRWLVTRMRNLSKEIMKIILNEHGTDGFLKRISDPFWFQSFGCVLGYDWHSSGVTTVVTGVLKHVVTPDEHGIGVCGGKGRASRQTPHEIAEIGERFGFSLEKIQNLHYASRMTAKVDNAAIQAGYHLYHHSFFLTEDGKWTVIQQGLCPQDRTARRYHWLSEHIDDFVVQPHDAIVGDVKRDTALDMTARESEECRKVSVDIAREPTRKVQRMLMSIRSVCQRSLEEYMPKTSIKSYTEPTTDSLSMPRRINWKKMREVYEFQPRNYEELLAFKGVGPATIRGLALIAQLIYGEEPSWKDPVKYSFAYGGKDGVPYPVNRDAMDESTQILKQAIEQAQIGKKEKIRSLQRLRRLAQREATYHGTFSRS